MKFISLFASAIVFCSILISPPSFSNILGNDRVIACSSSLGADFNACPLNIQNLALTTVPIHTDFFPCSNPPRCDAVEPDWEHLPKTDFVTIFDVDNQQTKKFKITVYPNVYDNRRNLIISGRKTAEEFPASQTEKEVTKAFHEVSVARKAVADAYNLKVANSGTITDATGAVSGSLPWSALTCKTAWDYNESTSSCNGDLNRDIRDGVRDNAASFAFVNSLEKLESVVKVIVPAFDLSNVGKLSSFVVQIYYPDGSVLAIDVKVRDGSVTTQLMEGASYTTSGQNFKTVASRGVSSIGSLEEALSIGGGSGALISCHPAEFSYSSMEVIRTFVTILPGGIRNVVNVYAERDNYFVYNKCD